VPLGTEGPGQLPPLPPLNPALTVSNEGLEHPGCTWPARAFRAAREAFSNFQMLNRAVYFIWRCLKVPVLRVNKCLLIESKIH